MEQSRGGRWSWAAIIALLLSYSGLQILIAAAPSSGLSAAQPGSTLSEQVQISTKVAQHYKDFL